MKSHKEILEIFQSGIYEFVEIAVKQQHERLLGTLPDVTRSGYTRPVSCSQCNRNNLQPRHSKDNCPSSKSCFCKDVRRDKRPCPNFICDYICEGIIKEHMKYSPNFKTTNVSQWTKAYWSIAKCYMEHSSQSAKDTDILDLLHLIANNKFVFQKVFVVAKDVTEEKLQEQLNTVIRSCRQIKRLAGSRKTDLENICLFLSKLNDENASKAEERIRKIALNIGSDQNGDKYVDDVGVDLTPKEYYKKAKNALSCSQKNGTEAKSGDLDYLQLSAEQKLHVGETVESFEQDAKNESNVFDLIYGSKSKRYNTIFVEDTDDGQQNSTQWSKKKWLIFNIMDVFFNKLDKDENKKDYSSSESTSDKYSGVILVSQSVSNKLGIPFKSLCEVYLKDFLKSKESYIVIMDISGTANIDEIQHDGEHFKRHTVVKILNPVNFRSQTANKDSIIVFVKPNPVEKLTIKHKCKGATLQKETIGVIQQMIYKSVKKIGCPRVSLTFENIVFDDISTKIKLSCVSEIPCLQMIDCAFTPSNVKIVRCIEINFEETCILHYIDQIQLILYPAIQNYQYLPCIKSSEIVIGNKSFCIKISLETMNTVARKCYRRPLKNCSKENIQELVNFEMSKILKASGCDMNDYEYASEKEKYLVLDSVRYGLLTSNLNFVHVFPAERHLKNKRSHDIVFVCFMKENYDVDEENVFRIYRGFQTFQRSYNAVSTESLRAESSICTYDFQTEEIKARIEETVAFHSDSLMKKHSNLEVISVSMGKAKDDKLDTTKGPYIVLYVRLRSFIPKGEDPFPDRLAHPNKTTTFPTDIREGYYIPLSDRERRTNTPFEKLTKLLMGCSFGMTGNEAAGTVGPFVQIESGEENSTLKEDGFLTACHNFCLPENAKSILGTQVVQPSDGDEIFKTFAKDKDCGEVVACAYTEDVDAALVKITKRHPDKGAFISCHKRDHKDAGLRGEIKYDDGHISDPKDAYKKTVLKIGKKTYLTSGTCLSQSNAVTFVPEDKLLIRDPVTMRKQIIVMKNMFHFMNAGDEEICDHGDSGAGVFVVLDNGELSCIGMAIGKTSDRKCVATPINRILETLSKTNNTTLKNLKVTMKKFS